MIYVLFNDKNDVVAIYTDSSQAQQDCEFLKNETHFTYYVAEFTKTNANRYEYIKE